MEVDAGGPEYDVRVPGIPGTGIFLIFLWYRKKLVPDKVSEKVSEKNWYRKKSRNRHWKTLVPENSLVTDIGKPWYRKKSLGAGIGKIWYQSRTGNFSFLLVVSEPVSE